LDCIEDPAGVSPVCEPLLHPAANARLNVTPATFAAVLDMFIQE
jgi:hypothetical protein